VLGHTVVDCYSVDEPVTGLPLALVGANGTSICHNQGVVPTQLDSGVCWGHSKTGHRCNLCRMVQLQPRNSKKYTYGLW
jgi:hypothetical protein